MWIHAIAKRNLQGQTKYPSEVVNIVVSKKMKSCADDDLNRGSSGDKSFGVKCNMDTRYI